MTTLGNIEKLDDLRSIWPHEAHDFSRGWDIFVRKSKDKLYGETPRFIYLGKGVPVEYSGNKPIQFKIKLIDPVPDELYEELNQ